MHRPRSLLALAASTVLLAACDDAVARPPRAPIPTQTYFAPQTANLPPGGAYQPGWSSGNTMPIAMQPAPIVSAPPRNPGSVSNAQAVVAAMAPAFRRCYNAGLQEDAEMKGSIRVTAKIDATGAVASASPSGSGLSEKVASCVVTVVANAQFAPPEGGGATVVIPVTFVSQPAAPAVPANSN